MKNIKWGDKNVRLWNVFIKFVTINLKNGVIYVEQYI